LITSVFVQRIDFSKKNGNLLLACDSQILTATAATTTGIVDRIVRNSAKSGADK